MKQFTDLSPEEKLEVYNRAFTFVHDHADRIHKLIKKETPVIAPSGSDMFHPELWKAIHWKWFFVLQMKRAEIFKL